MIATAFNGRRLLTLDQQSSRRRNIETAASFRDLAKRFPQHAPLLRSRMRFHALKAREVSRG